jgi:hypothetical protein
MNIEVNYIAVLLAGIVSMLIGFLWYSPILFAKPWMKLRGYTQESLKKAQKEMGNLYALSFIVSLLTAFVLSHVMTLSQNFYQYPPLMTGLTTAFFMWIGFMFPVQVTSYIFGEKKWGLLMIDTGYQLASVVGMAIVLSLF